MDFREHMNFSHLDWRSGVGGSKLARSQQKVLYISDSVDQVFRTRWSEAYHPIKDLLWLLAKEQAGTMAHSLRVSRGIKAFLRWMGVSEEEAAIAEVGGLLHDIGKIWVPESILGKEGSLDNDEWKYIKEHPKIGSDSLRAYGLPDAVADYALLHHEQWDGRGYPKGLSGTQIPFKIRCFSIVDVYDALRSVRPYRREMKHSDAMATIEAGKGTQFDPEVVELFIEWQQGLLQRG